MSLNRMASTTFSTFTTDVSTTDVSSSLSVLSNSLANETNPEYARVMIEKQQLVHQCEMMKIEIAQQKQQVLDLKAQHEAHNEEISEQLHCARHAHQVLQYKYNNTLDQHSKELKAAQEANSDQISMLRSKQVEIESLLPGLQVKSHDLRNTLLNVHVTPEQYSTLSVKPREDLTIKELIHLTYYEGQLPLHKHIEEISHKLHHVQEQHSLTKQEVKALEANVTIEKQSRVVTENENSELRQKIETLSRQLDPEHKANYKNVVDKNNELEGLNKQLLTANTYMKAELSALKEENKKTGDTFSSLRQESALLIQDKQYLSKENSDLTARVHRSEEKLDNLQMELESAKRSRDKVYEELVNVRTDIKQEHESKLQNELDLIKQRTSAELQQLRDTGVKVYEREKQLLLDSKEAAIADRNEALRKHSQLQEKYSDLSESYHNHQSNTSAKIADYSNDMKLKQFELERINVLYTELTSKYGDIAKENEKLKKKLEVMVDEYNSSKSDFVTEINNVRLKCRTLQNELSTFTSGDHEIKDIISVLGSENISCNKEYMARKLVELSKNNDILKESLGNKEAALEKSLRACEELRSSLHHSNQPSSYLVESIKKRDQQISTLKSELNKISEEYDKLKTSNKKVLSDKEQMMVDMEKLMKNKEKLSDLKKIVNNKVSMSEKSQPKPVVFRK